MADDPLPVVQRAEAAARDALRASHEDRDNVVEQLRVAGGDGRLDAEELDQRVGAALVARTHGDLPAVPGFHGTHVTTPKDVVRIDCSGGNTGREGNWVVPQRMEVVVHGGNVKLDFTEAQFSWPTLSIDADVYGGNLTLIIKPGIVVDAGDVVVRGGNVKVKAPWGSSGGVTLRIDATGKIEGGNLKARPARRSLSAWLRRVPYGQ
jgi:hypothetical protein